MRTVFRPYIKFVNVPANGGTGGAIGVQLNDDRGYPISCNFVSVTTSAGTGADENWLLLTPSGMKSGVPLGPSGFNSVAEGHGANGASGTTASANDGSGILGDVCPANGGTAQLVLGIGDRVESINLSNWGTDVGLEAEIACMITYGNVNVQNTIRDTMFGRGS